ncbi:hypothetical protein [uncultured Lacinutrix sp.]|uniref:hypothetical protein n=1 Tax=uncultured Lacinutrix sp. TaxID=574032 RepID=UPI00260C5255|nr:hypothetical protein [uncultured Lacinutrix sp.]
MNTILKIALIAVLLVYAGGLTYTYYSDYKFQQQFDLYDLDKNNMLNGDEITDITREFLNKKAARKSTKQAMIILIPVSLIIGLFVFGMAYLFKKIKTINDNEILYK